MIIFMAVAVAGAGAGAGAVFNNAGTKFWLNIHEGDDEIKLTERIL